MPKPKPRRPLTDEELLRESLDEIARDYSRRQTRRPRRSLRELFGWLDRRVLVGVVGLVVILGADGVRRENLEFCATAVAITGQVTAMSASAGNRSLEVGMQLTDGDHVVTGPSARATLSFPDGSSIVVGPDSEFAIKLLEYSRGGSWRARSFSLLHGEVWARVGRAFGHDSELRIYTPACVAAVRGTTFGMGYAPQNLYGQVICTDGRVQVMGWQGLPVFVGAGMMTGVYVGQAAAIPWAAPAGMVAPFTPGDLIRSTRAPSWLQRLEGGLNQACSAPLDLLGVGKAGWAFGAIDKTRRAAAMLSLNRLRIGLGFTAYPEYIDPATLQGLGVSAQEAADILKNLDGNALESYRLTNDGQDFIAYGRARDGERTLYLANSSGVMLVPE
jgi:hypothetical protein